MEKSISHFQLKNYTCTVFDLSKYQIYQNIWKNSIQLRCQENENIICLLFKFFLTKIPR